MENIKKELGLRIKSYRKEHGYTQEVFSSMIKLENKNLSGIEKGKRLPQTSTLLSMIKNGGIEPNFLLDFLYKSKKPYSSLDFEIIEHVINLSDEQKELIKNLIISFKK